jgi:hypothetical protein
MRARRTGRFIVYTSTGMGSYRSRSKAIAAAQWVAGKSGDSVAVASETTGQRWEVSPVGLVSDPS